MSCASNYEMDQLARHEWSWEVCIENKLQELQALVVCYETKHVLLKKEKNRWILPGRLFPNSRFPSAFQPYLAIPDLHHVIGAKLSLTVLRQAWRRVRRVCIGNEILFLEKTVLLVACALCKEERESKADVDLQTHGYQWIPIDQAHIFHADEEALAKTKEEMNWVMREAQPENRLSWQRRGWMASTVSWMLKQLESKCSAPKADDISHIRSSHLGTILRANTTTGCFFLKCTSALANDASYTQALGEIVPDYVAPPVAVDLKKQMMLTADYGEILSPWDLSDAERKRLTRSYVQLQIATIDRVEELITAGMPDMRVPKLLEHVDRLAGCCAFQSLGNSESSQKDVEFFCKNIDLFKAEIGKLETFEFPATVTHNDLTTSNIYKPDGKDNYMFFDFVEGYVSHPFVLWLQLLHEETYLREWSAWSEAGEDELPKLLYTGGTCHLLALIILHLREAQAAEFPECEEHFGSVRSSLRKFNRCFAQ